MFSVFGLTREKKRGLDLKFGKKKSDKTSVVKAVASKIVCAIHSEKSKSATFNSL